MHDVLNELNESQRELFFLPMSRVRKIEAVSQERSLRARLETGFLLQTRGKITTVLANRTTTERRDGSLRLILSQNGNLLVQIRFYGFMENVRA
jgi:hypothetical protein